MIILVTLLAACSEPAEKAPETPAAEVVVVEATPTPAAATPCVDPADATKPECKPAEATLVPVPPQETAAPAATEKAAH